MHTPWVTCPLACQPQLAPSHPLPSGPHPPHATLTPFTSTHFKCCSTQFQEYMWDKGRSHTQSSMISLPWSQSRGVPKPCVGLLGQSIVECLLMGVHAHLQQFAGTSLCKGSTLRTKQCSAFSILSLSTLLLVKLLAQSYML